MPNTLAQNAQIIDGAVDDIKDEIALKGVTVPSPCPITSIPTLIRQIDSGGLNKQQLINLIQGTTQELYFPSEVTQVRTYAFYGHTELTKVIINEGCAQIGDNAFGNCTNITSVTIPESVTSIGGSCFKNCTSLTSITIPESVTSIGGSCFENCTSLVNISLPEGITALPDNCFYDCATLSSIIIPESVTKIGTNCFRGCRGLTSIVIPENVTNIYGNCFDGCLRLANITIPESVTSFGVAVFRNSGLTDIYYAGTQAQWESIGNIHLISIPEGCTIHYEYSPAESE